MLGSGILNHIVYVYINTAGNILKRKRKNYCPLNCKFFQRSLIFSQFDIRRNLKFYRMRQTHIQKLYSMKSNGFCLMLNILNKSEWFVKIRMEYSIDWHLHVIAILNKHTEIKNLKRKKPFFLVLNFLHQFSVSKRDWAPFHWICIVFIFGFFTNKIRIIHYCLII